ncbi:hypothetical protein GCM10010394_05030 [Streptomyces crystallinus]|uniref:Uncharacterized protein n=1 Tax=Streptomyces crystallinus TaxID=68191 RepID=A0ABP3Q1J5_9ACTN
MYTAEYWRWPSDLYTATACSPCADDRSWPQYAEASAWGPSKRTPANNHEGGRRTYCHYCGLELDRE